MNARLKINMLEVTRLTRDGRLDEAMAILRGVIPSAVIRQTRGETRNQGLKAQLSRWWHHLLDWEIVDLSEVGRRRSSCQLGPTKPVR